MMKGQKLTLSDQSHLFNLVPLYLDVDANSIKVYLELLVNSKL